MAFGRITETSSMVRCLFNEVLRHCVDAGLVKGERLQWTPAASKRKRVGGAVYRAMDRSIGATRPSAAAPCVSA